LKRAYDGDCQSGWSFWVATDSYDDMPAPDEYNKPNADGTKPPLLETWSSPWAGKTVEDCAEWLQKMPSVEGPQYYHHTSVDRNYFLAMDEYSEGDDTILVCRVTKKENGELRVDFVPQATVEVQMYMWTNQGIMLDGRAEQYKRTMALEEKPDRSRFKPGGPY
jgi:hypothetical protein